ncbi:acyltransferase [Pseudarthrobacter sp. SL88]|uniref:acyltransferase n=1 Tax=Pseudarthrobacter sp. SL88 TaxID=2994666 RepID=UPI0022756195|nr:acyltransferase [Pseudarthrobacter sp. SL88]MCY1673810.1 acyltransferase [Pseudarthrobacter sp. SL88]
MRLYLQGLKLWIGFMVGRIPIHAFRISVYRRFLGIQIGPASAVHWRLAFFAPRGIRIGRNSIVGNDCFLDGRLGLEIGNNVNIGGHVQIFTVGHDPSSPTFGTKGGAVRIGDRAYIASRATVLPNVDIGEGAVVAAGAVVSKDVAPYTIVGGIPAAVIGQRNRDLSYELNFHMPFQ